MMKRRKTKASKTKTAEVSIFEFIYWLPFFKQFFKLSEISSKKATAGSDDDSEEEDDEEDEDEEESEGEDEPAPATKKSAKVPASKPAKGWTFFRHVYCLFEK